MPFASLILKRSSWRRLTPRRAAVRSFPRQAFGWSLTHWQGRGPFREGFDAGRRRAGTASGAPRSGDGVALQEQCVPSSSFRGVWEVCSDGARGGGQAAPAARAEPGPPHEGFWQAGAAMEEDGRAALHEPRRAFDGVQGGTAGERAPRPALLLESLAGPGSDDGVDGGFVGGPVDGDADGDTACPGPPARSEPVSHVLEYLDRFGAAALSGGTAGGLERGAAGSERAAAAASSEGHLPFLDEFGLAAVAAAARGPLSGGESLLDLAEGRAEDWLRQRELTLGDRAEVEARAESLLLQKGFRSDS
ncbi:unnamed protein product [Prorocentrum cordatum]|uniref:Type II protein arginine methyltransferase n=1 Tax=Prorocentrum cordatum TaxID=2364126 RepID=A0ABN9WYB1_9DINO|nr:unnamed protein product [Polarella glacialis]